MMKSFLFSLILFVILYSNLSFGNYILGIDQFNEYKNNFENKNIGFIVNHSSKIQAEHSIDFFLKNKINIKKLFSVEHGLRGNLPDGEEVKDGIDVKTNLPVVSLYGKKKKPDYDDLKNLDLILFDIQDVGVRFYTYISTLYLTMESALENDKEFILFDRPNYFVNIVDGPILKKEFKSFIGIHEIPLIYGMTIGELGLLFKDAIELKHNKSLKFKLIKLKNYKRDDVFKFEVNPSPNLRSLKAIELYPSLALFEPTQISIGRGTFKPFTMIGHPFQFIGDYTFTPKSIKELSAKPKHLNKLCYGLDLSKTSFNGLNLQFFRNIIHEMKFNNLKIFNSKRYFNLLIGDDLFIETLDNDYEFDHYITQMKLDNIEWMKIREKYLLY